MENLDNLDFLFIGSTHSFFDDFSKQKEVINSVKPEIVLDEELEDLVLDSPEKFDGFFESKYISEMTSFEEVENLARLCFKDGVKLIGIDFHNFGFSDVLIKKIKEEIELDPEEEERLSDLTTRREKYHLKKILEFRGKSEKPVVVIVGCWHLRKGSLIRSELKNCKIVAPLDNDGEVLSGPNGNDVKYGEIIF